MFAGDAAALEAFREAWLKKGEFDPAAFQSHKNYFAQRNVTAIVLELPTESIGELIGSCLGDGVAGWARSRGSSLTFWAAAANPYVHRGNGPEGGL